MLPEKMCKKSQQNQQFYFKNLLDSPTILTPEAFLQPYATLPKSSMKQFYLQKYKTSIECRHHVHQNEVKETIPLKINSLHTLLVECQTNSIHRKENKAQKSQSPEFLILSITEIKIVLSTTNWQEDFKEICSDGAFSHGNEKKKL